MSAESHLSLTREQLYELAWSKPMQHLAKEYGISDRAMAKLCTRNQVPVPPRGYWAKKNSGQKITRPPLPAFVAKEKPKPEPPEPEIKKPPTKKAKVSSPWEERERKIKQIIRDHRSRLLNSAQYTILIDGWGCDYSFGLNSMFDPLRPYKHIVDYIHREPFRETRYVVFNGIFLVPSQLKEQKVEVHLSQSRYLNEAERDKNPDSYSEDPPKAIGFLEKRKPVSRCDVSFPEDAVHIVLAAALANKIKYITLYGEKMRYRQASIFNFSLTEKPEEEE